MAKKIKLGSRSFGTRQAAAQFLSENPDFVKFRLGNLAKGSPKLLQEAGYTLKQDWGSGAKYVLLKDGATLWKSNNLPDPIKDVKPGAGAAGHPDESGKFDLPGRTNPPRGGGGRPPQRTGTQNNAGPPPVPGPVDMSSGIDYAGLAAQMGIDPALLQGLRPNVGNLIPLRAAQRGAQVMGPEAIEALIGSMIGDSFKHQESVIGQERGRTEAQNAHNLAQIERWYGQVMGSQGVAAERDREFGRAAVASQEDATRGILSALGGEASEGAGMVGAAGQENVGLLNAVGTIQDQYNADMAPLLAGEQAGQLAREQAMGGERLRDLSMRLSELQSQRGSREAEMRFNLWQSNNDILDRKLQNELAIRQANAGLQQQRFANQVGIRQMGIAAATAGMEGLTDVATIAQRDAEAQGQANEKAADRQFRMTMEAMKERGRMYRSQLSAKSKGAGGGLDFGKILTNDKQAKALKDRAFNALQSAASSRGLDVEDLSEADALKLLVGWARSVGLPVKNEAVKSLLLESLYE